MEGDLVPEYIVDRFDGGESEVVEIAFEDLPRSEVAEFARRGDTEAQRWLDEHPPNTER